MKRNREDVTKRKGALVLPTWTPAAATEAEATKQKYTTVPLRWQVKEGAMK